MQKSGTTALFEELTALPRVGKPLLKETHYFDLHRSRPLHWYYNHFWGDDADEPLLWGEATPAYFDSPRLPADIVGVLPNVKIIITLRDPVARAVSHYFHAVEFGWERRSIAEAFSEELRILGDGGWRDAAEMLRCGYLARSCYSTALRRWFDLVPRDRICVVVSEQRREALQQAGNFLGALDGKADDALLRDSNRRPYSVPPGLDLAPVTSLFRAECEGQRRLLGWSEVPAEWVNVTTD